MYTSHRRGAHNCHGRYCSSFQLCLPGCYHYSAEPYTNVMSDVSALQTGLSAHLSHAWLTTYCPALAAWFEQQVESPQPDSPGIASLHHSLTRLPPHARQGHETCTRTTLSYLCARAPHRTAPDHSKPILYAMSARTTRQWCPGITERVARQCAGTVVGVAGPGVSLCVLRALARSRYPLNLSPAWLCMVCGTPHICTVTSVHSHVRR
jgi:hypothetical protein